MTRPITNYAEANKIIDQLQNSQQIVVMQADNPDADSLGSALALEQILGDMGKDPILYCGVEMPGYLRYLSGWDRVVRDIPRQFDASIIVDTSTMTLFDKLQQSGQKNWVASKPCIVLDHHSEVGNAIPFASVMINDATRSSTGELIYRLAQQLDWPLSTEAQTNIMTAILGDTQGLSNQLTSAETYFVMAEMTEAGVNRSLLEEARRETNKMPAVIYKYKGRLIGRTELLADSRLAVVVVPQSEINEYSPLYNPGPLIQSDMLQTKHVRVSIVFKHYDDGRITAAIRCNHGAGIAAKIAENFGGGGHAYASGFKVNARSQQQTICRPFDDVKTECVQYATKLLDELED